MIAERKIMRVSSQKIEVDLGDNYKAFLNQDVEIVIFPCFQQEPAANAKQTEWRSMEATGPLAVLGFAKTFRDTRTTGEWMDSLRDGEEQ